MFSSVSTFSAHLSRKHRDSSEGNLVVSVAHPGGMSESSDHQSEVVHEAPCDEGPSMDQDDGAESVNEALFLRHLALFYLKLQSKCLLPSSVIQTIVSEFQEIHDMSKEHLLFKLRDKLAALQLPERDICAIVDVLRSDDLFQTCNSHILNTDQKRKNLL